MGGILETVVGNLAAAAVITPQAFAASSPNTFTIRNATGQMDAQLISLWGNTSVNGSLRVRSPRLHDANQSVRIRQLLANPSPTFPPAAQQNLFSQDSLTVEYLADVAPAAAAPQGIALQVYYPDLVGGSASSSRHWAEVEPFIANILGQDMTPTSSAVQNNWGPGQVLNATADSFKAGKNYAVLGYVTSDVGLAFAISGADTGNYLVGGPLTTDALVTHQYFVDLAEQNGLPCIPVISANNKLSTLVQVASGALSTVFHVSLILAELTN